MNFRDNITSEGIQDAELDALSMQSQYGSLPDVDNQNILSETKKIPSNDFPENTMGSEENRPFTRTIAHYNLDLLYHIKGMYRLLELVGDRGGDGIGKQRNLV
jgi:hypothetical protein